MVSVEEIIEEGERLREEKRRFPVWGTWQLTKNLSLELKGDHWYEVDLERCLSSAEILDWIVQIQKKSWVTPKIIYDLIQALDDILDIQGNFCSSGKNLRPSKDLILGRIRAFTPVLAT